MMFYHGFMGPLSCFLFKVISSRGRMLLRLLGNKLSEELLLILKLFTLAQSTVIGERGRFIVEISKKFSIVREGRRFQGGICCF